MTDPITMNRQMQELIHLAKTVAQSKATVLIQGESGTGKEVIAHLIHENSARHKKPLVAINCAAIPESLLESELFGYERGAFTGAIANKVGKFELASSGTLLLDEISEMDIRLQAKLLRVIQEGEVDRIGGRKPVDVDVRIIATTNKNLSECVTKKTFREDLFYRLNVVHLTLPPLRERICDIALLAKHFMSVYSKKNNQHVTDLCSQAIEFLESHSWPGNVRELENVIERAVITSKQSIINVESIWIDHRPLVSEPLQTNSQFHHSLVQNWLPGSTLDDIERNVIIDALKYHRGNRTHTAQALGISVRTLRNKITFYKKNGITL